MQLWKFSLTTQPAEPTGSETAQLTFTATDLSQVMECREMFY